MNVEWIQSNSTNFFFAVPKSFYFWLHFKHRPRAIIDAQYTHQCNVQIEIMLEANSIGTWISFFHYTKIEILCSTFRLKYKVQVVIKNKLIITHTHDARQSHVFTIFSIDVSIIMCVCVWLCWIEKKNHLNKWNWWW